MFSRRLDADPHNLYKILEIKPGCSEKDIKQAYRRLALIHHPDKNLNDPTASDTFSKINHAYEILSDEAKRQVYDNSGTIDGKVLPTVDGIFQYFHDVLVRNNFFTDIKNFMNDRPPQINIDIYLTLSEVIFGTTKEISFTRQVLVDVNNNTIDPKNIPQVLFTCQKCNGTGYIVQRNGNVNFGIVFEKQVSCLYCDTNGWINLYPDKYKFIEKGCRSKYYIKPGILENSKIRIEGIGHLNPRNINENGDVELNIQYLPHDNFKLDANYNLIYYQDISVFESITGTEVIISHLNGDNLYITLSENILPDFERTIKNYGLKQGSSHSHFILRFNIIYPQYSISDKDKDYFRKNFSEYYHITIKNDKKKYKYLKI